MIDNFALGLTHGLLILAAWRLLYRPDLDSSAAMREGETPSAWGKRKR